MASSPLRLAMSILARDEIDVIRENVRFHARAGVDAFVVTDNGSVDGTREALDELAREVELIVIDEPMQTLDQDRWVTRMARVAEERLGADWIVNNDADEFWCAAGGNLKNAIDDAHTIVSCRRVNVLPRASDVARQDYRFYDNVAKVQRPYPPTAPAADPRVPLSAPIMLREIGPKVMCRIAGLRFVYLGNHQVVHDEPRACSSDSVEIWHYPVRTYAQFERKVQNYGLAIRDNPRFDSDISWHLRRWFAQLEAGELRREYEQIVPDDERLAGLVQAGVVTIDRSLQAPLRALSSAT